MIPLKSRLILTRGSVCFRARISRTAGRDQGNHTPSASTSGTTASTTNSSLLIVVFLHCVGRAAGDPSVTLCVYREILSLAGDSRAALTNLTAGDAIRIFDALSLNGATEDWQANSPNATSNGTRSCQASIKGLTTCTSGEQALFPGEPINQSQALSEEQLSGLCPKLLYMLVSDPCLNQSYDIHGSGIYHTDTEPIDIKLVWASGIGAVVLISLFSLAVVSIIPRLSHGIYKALVQYLVALAVGALVGDALLHLLPHAFIGKDHSYHGDETEDNSRAAVYRGAISLAGIFLFFNTERVFGIITMKKNSSRDQRPRPDIAVNVERSSSCGSCAIGPVVVGHSSEEMKKMMGGVHQDYHQTNDLPCQRASSSAVNSRNYEEQTFLCDSAHPRGVTIATGVHRSSSDQGAPCALSLRYLHTSDKQYWTGNGSEQLAACCGVTSGDKQLDATNSDTPLLNQMVIIESKNDRNNNHGAHDHNSYDPHSHSHSHQAPGSLSAAACMVMMGDGLHKFTDGLAIGAAFSSSLVGGASTSLAILCHELPHALGDFAMLLKVGMTLRQAFMCVIMSAFLQLIGAVISIAAGTTGSSQVVFALAGGIFLYIGLVDMLPEIARVNKVRPWRQLLLQNLGLLSGLGVMFTIAFYEHDLKASLTMMPRNR